MSDATKLYIEVDLGNDAMQTASDVALSVTRSLHGQASSLFDPLNQHEVGTIRDGNGNTVGKWEVR